jgi:acyl-CoA reductase-like NAD-dependent aldehyde dehydrogenase
MSGKEEDFASGVFVENGRSVEFPDLADAVAELSESAADWLKVPPRERAELLATMRHRVAGLADCWVSDGLRSKGAKPGGPSETEEWFTGPWGNLLHLRRLEQAMYDIERKGRPIPPGEPHVLPNDQVAVDVFPVDRWDSMFFSGVKAEIRMRPGVQLEDVTPGQARAYRESMPGVALVLGGGNCATIAVGDVLRKLFVENRVVLFKPNPLSAYTGPIISEAFQPLIEQGFLRVVQGGAEEGQWLCRHKDITDIHVTGSNATYDAIVASLGGDERKEDPVGRRTGGKLVTSELGNVSPVIVVPGQWSDKDLEYGALQAVTGSLISMGFNCCSHRLMITHDQWSQRSVFIDNVRDQLAALPSRESYYPEAPKLTRAFAEAHETSERYGEELNDRTMCWNFLPDLDSSEIETPLFKSEVWGGVLGESTLRASDPAAFLDEAVEFCNEHVWGNLSITLIVHPSSLADPELASALERAVDNLRYGTVALNFWPGIAALLNTTFWGAYPEQRGDDIQSGDGLFGNTFMFELPQKTVVRAPFRTWPRPLWFLDRPNSHRAGRVLASFEAEPSWLGAARVSFEAMRE